MDWLIIIALIIGGIVLHAVIDNLIGPMDRLFNKTDEKRIIKENTTDNNFIIRYRSDVKALVWVCFVIFGLPCIFCVVATALGAIGDDESLGAKIFLTLFFSLFAIASIFTLIYFLKHKIKFTDRKITICKIFYKVSLSFDQIKELRHVYFNNKFNSTLTKILIYYDDNKCFSIRTSFLNFEKAEKLLGEMNIEKTRKDKTL
jgi:hypothetical protein